MIGAIAGDGARFATMSLWVMALALIAKGAVPIVKSSLKWWLTWCFDNLVHCYPIAKG